MNKPADRASGQASAEALLAAVVLLALWLSIAWIGRLQHRSLAADQASRQAAFSAAQGQPQQPFLTGRTLQYTRLASPPDFIAVGGTGTNPAALRRDWHVQDEGLLKASANIVPAAAKNVTPIPTDGYKRPQSDPIIWRHTLVLIGDGHAADDLSAQTLVERSYVGWQSAYKKSKAAALNVNTRVAPLDQPWQRPPLQTDWLAAWSDLIPEDRLQPTPRN